MHYADRRPMAHERNGVVEEMRRGKLAVTSETHRALSSRLRRIGCSGCADEALQRDMLQWELTATCIRDPRQQQVKNVRTIVLAFTG